MSFSVDIPSAGSLDLFTIDGESCSLYWVVDNVLVPFQSVLGGG